MTASEEIEAIARKANGEGLDRINDPKWGNHRFRWEHYVPHDLQEVWPHLTNEAKLVAYVCALELLSSDDPDSGPE